MTLAKTARIRREKLLAAAEGYLFFELPEHALASLAAIEDPHRAVYAVNFQKGLALRQLERHQAALEAFQLAQAEDPDQVPLLLAMAWCYKRTNRLMQAISAMEHAYRVAPDQSIVLYNLACYWSLLGNKTQALSWLGRALRMDQSLRKLIPDEHDFDLLRDDPDFEMMVGLPDDISRSK
jgi:tetratricopeptide (TPR) repeat protein